MDGDASTELRSLAPQVIQLFSAVTRGDKDETARLLRLGIPVNDLDPVSTDSPLMVACRKGFADIVQLCLEYGAKNDPHPDFGQTALHACVASIQHACASVLLKVAAESEADDLICNLTDQNGQTPLHTAAVVGSSILAELLLRHGASLGALDAFGQTPIHLAAGSAVACAIDCLALLLSEGGDDPSLLDLPDVFGNTPLHHAAYHGRIESARLLLQSAADVSLRNAKNLTAYNLATTQGHHPLALLLLDYRDSHRDSSKVNGSSNKPSTYSTPSQKQSRSAWATPLQSASKTAQYQSHNRPRIFSDDQSSMMFATPLTSERPNSNGHRTFMHADYFHGDDDLTDMSQKDAVYINISNNYSDVKNSTNKNRNNRWQKEKVVEAQLPRPHTVTQSSPSATVLKRSSGSGGSGHVSATSSPRPSYTARPEDITVSLPARYEEDSTPLKRRSPLRSSAPAQQSFAESKVDAVPHTAEMKHQQYYHNRDRFHQPDKHSHNTNNTGTAMPSMNDAYYQHHEYPESSGYAHSSEYYVTTDSTTNESFMPPLEEFFSYDRQWASYETEDGFVYYLSNDEVTGEAHSQWEDPRHYGVILSTYTETTTEVEGAKAAEETQNAQLDLNMQQLQVAHQCNISPDSSAASSGRQSPHSPFRSRSPSNGNNSNPNSPQRHPPLSPALRSQRSNSRSPASLFRLPNAAAQHQIQSPPVNNSSINSSGILLLNESKALDDDDDDDAMKVLVNMLDDVDASMQAESEGHVARTIDWDKETTTSSAPAALLNEKEVNRTLPPPHRKNKKTKSNRAAFLR